MIYYNYLSKRKEQGLMVTQEKREKRITFKVTEKESEQIQKLANEHGLSLSAYIRLLLSEQVRNANA